MSSSNRSAFNLRSSRLTLLIGFGSLLAIIAVSGVDALRVLRQFRNEDDQIRREFLFRNRVLNNIRSEVYVSGTYVRDYLLEPNASRAAAFGVSLSNVRKQMESDLASYAGQVKPEESGQYSALQRELAQYWEILGPSLKWDARQRQAEGYAFLRDEVFPRRTAMLDIAGAIADINERQLNQGNQHASELLAKFRNRLAVTLFGALALGLGMAGFSARKILDLEAHAESRYQEVAEARTQLTNLSARLVGAQESERRSLSRELHDEVGQSLSAVLVELRNLSGLVSGSEQQVRSQLEVIKGLVEGAVRVVRNMALLLRPSMLDDLGLIPALKWQAREVSKRTSMDVTVATELISEDLPDEYKTCIYRIVQEALHNCSRHSRATLVRIRVHQKETKLVLSVQDDGAGFDVRHSKGLGLLGIEERVAQLGGTCQIHSGPDIGTLLTVELPFEDRPHAMKREPSEANTHPVSG